MIRGKSVGRLVLLLASFGLAGEGAAQAGERIVLCKERVGSCQAASVLGEVDGGAWAKVDDAVLLSRKPLPPVLYYSNQQYDEAMAGLAGKERGQAITRRSEVVAGNLAGVLFEQLAFDLRKLVIAEGDAGVDVLLEAAAILEGGQQRMRGTKPGELLDMAREDLAEWMAELPKGSTFEAFAQVAKLLGELAADVHGDRKRAVLPVAEAARVYLLPSVPDKALRVLRDLGGYPHKWHGGVVAIASQRQLAEPPFKVNTAQGKAVKLLYPSRHAYLADLTDLTAAQLNQRLETRLGQGFDREAFVAQRAFAHAVFFRAITHHLNDSRVPWFDAWQSIARMDAGHVRQLLAATWPGAAQERSQRRLALQSDLALAAAILQGPAHARHAAMVARATETLTRLPSP
jgi:hypothetical protein